MKGPLAFACLGDSITSDQVTGIGTLVAEKLGMRLMGNFACGYTTCSDWHIGPQNTTRITLVEPQDTNTCDNVLSNQVRRLLDALPQRGQPDVIYIAISTNDGNHPQNIVNDDCGRVLASSYAALDRCSLASALRWAIETLRTACPQARIFVATPLQAWTDNPWMSPDALLQKRRIILHVCHHLGVQVIDSHQESGFTIDVARDHGGIHPDEEWKDRIAGYVAHTIRASLV